MGLGMLCGSVLALASGLVLHGSGLLPVAMAAAIVAGVVYGARRDDRAAACAAAWKAAGSTVAIIMLVVGAVVLAGGVAAAVVSGLAVAAGGAVWLRQFLRARAGNRREWNGAPRKDAALAASAPPPLWLDRSPAPVSLLTISVLSREWSRTTAALATPLEPTTRQVVIRRRQEVLDELEHRDPAGFARWLAAGATANCDPATFVRSDRAPGSDAA
jgi:hypothetical protein